MLTSLITLVAIFAPVAAGHDSVTVQDIQKAYATTISLSAVEDPVHGPLIGLEVAAPPARSLLSDFYAHNSLWFDYLVQNGRGFTLPGVDGARPKGFGAHGFAQATAKLQDEFVHRVIADSQFNAIVLPAIASWLRHSGVKVTNAIQPLAPFTIPIDTALKTAVRFFDPDIVTPTGILTHVCTHFNEVRNMPRRNIALEAFAFAAIMGDMQRDSTYIEPDFAPARKLMNELDSKTAPDEERINRAQGVMWASMARSVRLRMLLETEAKRNRVILAFRLVDSTSGETQSASR